MAKEEAFRSNISRLHILSSTIHRNETNDFFQPPVYYLNTYNT